MSDYIIKDFFMLPPPSGKSGGTSSNPEVRSSAVNSRGLLVTLEASHAGRITSNNALYPPKFMDISAHTFVLPRAKPIQVHHEDHSDPIGRVYSSRFVSYLDVNKTQYKDSVIRDGFSRLHDSASIDDIFDGLDILENSGIIWDENWKGLGELEVKGWITDQAAIEKILDGRYDTVSIQFSPKTVYCRKCRKDWRSDGGPCDHRPGEIIDGKKNYIVASPGVYGEFSYVNHPADPFAGNKSVQLVSMGEVSPLTNENLSGSLDKRDERHVVYEIVDSVIGEGVEISVEKNEQTSEIAAEDAVDTSTIADSTTTESSTDETVSEAAPVAEATPETQPIVDVDEALRILIEDEGSFTEELAELINDELEKLIESPVEDATLTAKQRKNMESSTFCGPKKSFPIPDCEHVTAARRLVGRYKGPGNKEAIMTCVNRKAKELGCDKSEDDGETEEDSNKTPDCNCLVRGMTNDEILSLRAGVDEEVVKRSLPARTCSDCEVKDSKIKELEGTIAHLREEQKIISADCVASDKALIEKTAKLQEVYKNTLVTFKQLTDKTSSLDEIKDSVNSLSVEELELTFNQTDLSPVVDFINSGLSKEVVAELPKEELPATPIKITDSVPATETEPQTINVDEVNYAKTIMSLRNSKGTQFAARYLDALKSAKKISSDWTLEKVSDLAAKSN